MTEPAVGLLTIRNHSTGQVVLLHRDVCTAHPEWVHQQCGYDPDCGMPVEVALQAMLDQIHSGDYAGRGRDECGIGFNEAYGLEMREECGGSEDTTIDAASQAEAIVAAEEEVRAWVRDGEYGDEGALVSAHYTLTDPDGDVMVDDREITVEIAPNHDALIRAAGGDSDCDHDWTSEGEGGCDQNPGVWSLGGTALTIASHCRRCGLHRVETLLGAQRNPGESDRVVYTQAESDAE